METPNASEPAKELRFRYELLNYGWAKLFLQLPGSGSLAQPRLVFRFPVSYLTDALGELATAIVRLLNGSEREVWIVDGEGEDAEWVLEKTDEGLQIRITLRGGWWKGEEWRKVSSVLSVETTLPHFASEVKRSMDRIYNDFGPEEYKERWIEHDFPRDEHLRLAKLLGSVSER